MLRGQSEPGLVAFYDIRSENGAGLFFQPPEPARGALSRAGVHKRQWKYLRHDFERCKDDAEDQTDESRRRISVLLWELDSDGGFDVLTRFVGRVRQVVLIFLGHRGRWTASSAVM